MYSAVVYHIDTNNLATGAKAACTLSEIWVVVKIRVPFWVPIIIRHLLFRVPPKGPSF